MNASAPNATTAKYMDMVGTFTFDEADGRTTLGVEIDSRPRGITSVLFPLLRPLVRRDFAKQHAKFVELCEAGREPRQSPEWGSITSS